jgi:hypothetical protein
MPCPFRLLRLCLLLHLFLCAIVTIARAEPRGTFSWLLQNIMTWVSRHGGDVSLIQPPPSGGRDIYTNALTEKGQVLLMLPKDTLISYASAIRSPLWQRYAELAYLPIAHGQQLCQTVTTYVFLENVVPGVRESSEFAMYYYLLPDFTYNHNIPLLNWDWDYDDTQDDDVDSSEAYSVDRTKTHPLDILLSAPSLGTYLASSIEGYRGLIAEYSREHGLFDKLSRDTGLSLKVLVKMYKWASATVISRSFPDGQEKCTLLPVIDMVNHREDANSVPSLLDNGSVALVGTRRILPGEPITINYDRNNEKCAEDMLMSFGFLPPEKKNCVKFGVGLQRLHSNMSSGFEAEQVSMLRDILPSAEINERGEKEMQVDVELNLVEGEGFPSWMMEALRLFVADEPALEIARTQKNAFAGPINLENEHSMLREARGMLFGVLNEIGDSEEMDTKALLHWQRVCEEDPGDPKGHCVEEKGVRSCALDETPRWRRAPSALYAQQMVIALQVKIRRRAILRDAIACVDGKMRELE